MCLSKTGIIRRMMDSNSSSMPTPANYGHELASNDPLFDAISLPSADSNSRWQLHRNAQGQLEISDQQQPSQRPLMIQFGSADIRRRIQAGRQQPMARACGLHNGAPLNIIDVTAGLGRDAWVLAALGASLQLHERHPLIHALLHDALRLAQHAGSATANRMQVLASSGQQALADLPNTRVDVLFLDPMFPASGRRAAPGLEMQIMQDLVGADDDAQQLWQLAMDSGVPRVVLKRPPRGAKVRLAQPDASFGGSKAVYDVYLRPALKRP